MRHDTSIHRAGLELAALEPIVETWPSRVQGACPFLGRLSLALGQCRAALARAVAKQRIEADLAGLDERLLQDIGLTRAEVSGWGPLGERIRPSADQSHTHI